MPPRVRIPRPAAWLSAGRVLSLAEVRRWQAGIPAEIARKRAASAVAGRYRGRR